MRSSTADRSAATSGDVAVGGVGEHVGGVVLVDVRGVEQAHPDLGFQHPAHAGVDLGGSAAPLAMAVGQVGVGRVEDGHLHVGSGVDRPGCRVGRDRLAKPWVTRFRTALASLTTKPSKPQVSRSTSVNSHSFPVAGMPFRSM